MDHLFSLDFEPKMVELAKNVLSKSPKTALVYRIFEIEDGISVLPKTKSDLAELFNSKQAFEFHHSYHAHKIPYLKEWFEANTNDVPSVQFLRPYKESAWEPQFVSLKTIPEHDESFLYPNRDNTVLRWEMCYAGYEFAVIHDVFMFHRGIKSNAENSLVRRARGRINGRTQKLIRKFEKRVKKKYEAVGAICPRFKL
ncbi:hypothetical protein L596_024126 [Steinernema carpocapsae]|nr:hypothetical protein L596_024126 [Steinernema carpocapsae]